jgi:hypothetical protein
MYETQKLINEIQSCKIYQTDRASDLIRKLQEQRDNNPAKADLVLYGIVLGIQKMSDYEIYELRIDDRLKELNEKIKEIEIREGLEKGEIFILGDPDTPEDYEELNIEFNHRIDEINAGIMREFGEDELAELFMNDRKEFIHRYHNGWRILEKDNPKALREIDEHEKLDLEEV